MDGSLGQYKAHVSTCSAGDEPVANLENAMTALLDAFFRRNNEMPKRIIIYRDGVSDSQFERVLEKEIHSYKEALANKGYGPETCQIAVVMCQKRHQTRLVYQEQSNHSDGNPSYINPCVGLCVDGRNFVGSNSADQDEDDPVGSISTPGYNEFYLNSHAAVLGTSKPCKYILIYDEIGLKVGIALKIFSSSLLAFYVYSQ